MSTPTELAHEAKVESERIVMARDIVASRTPDSYVEGFLIKEIGRSTEALRTILALCSNWEASVEGMPKVQPMVPTILIRQAIIDTMKEG